MVDTAPAMTPQQKKLTDDSVGALSLYKSLAVGDKGWVFLSYFEVCSLLFGGLPGLFGYGLRSLFYPILFNQCGKRPAFGRSVVLRQPNRITLGKKVLIDDFCALDAREDSYITIGDYASIGRLSTITAKNGKIVLGNAVNIGSYVRVATQSVVEIGDSTLIAGYAYIGAGNHQRSDNHEAMISGQMEIKGGVKIGKNCWIGSQAMIMDGVTIGDGAIIGAQSLVKENVPAGAIVVGTPARIIS